MKEAAAAEEDGYYDEDGGMAEREEKEGRRSTKHTKGGTPPPHTHTQTSIKWRGAELQDEAGAAAVWRRKSTSKHLNTRRCVAAFEHHPLCHLSGKQVKRKKKKETAKSSTALTSGLDRNDTAGGVLFVVSKIQIWLNHNSYPHKMSLWTFFTGAVFSSRNGRDF